jgi:ammonia channel protein AmtB
MYQRRVAENLLLVFALTAVSLIAGMTGYKLLGEHLSWYDAFANASMILSGMGPLSDLKSNGGKLFEGTYALYSGLVLIVSASLILGPVAHRFLHKMHLADEDES